jgi:EH domain-containing protein 1
VWALADARREGFLDATSFQRAMHLIALAQAGQEVSADALAAAIGRGEPLPRPSMGGGGDGGADAATTSGASPARPQARPLKPPPPLPPSSISSVVDGLASIYFSRIKPLEDAYKFGSFFSASYVRGDFNAKPSVLLLGQYSTGKTSFVEFCLGRPYPGSHVAPEPSTDRFVVVTSGPEDRRTPGHTLVVQPDLPYTSLASFGNGFLSKLEGVAVSGAPILDSLTFVDSPGVLSGEKQRVERSFNFVEVVSHLASRADAVYLFFDPAKLDVSCPLFARSERSVGAGTHLS